MYKYFDLINWTSSHLQNYANILIFVLTLIKVLLQDRILLYVGKGLYL